MICSNISSVSGTGSDQVKTCADQRPDLIACWIRSLLAFSRGVDQKPYHADSTATALTFRRFRVGDGNVEEERGWEREGWKEGLGGDLEETGEQEEAAHVASESALSPSVMTSPAHTATEPPLYSYWWWLPVKVEENFLNWWVYFD